MKKNYYKEVRIGPIKKKFPSDWEIIKLKKCIHDIGDGGTPSRKNDDYFGGNIKWAVISDIRNEIYDTKECLSKKGLESSSAKIWPINSIILSFGATIGNVGINKVPLATKQGIAGIVPNIEKLFFKYLYYLLQNYKKILTSYAQGSTIKEVRPNTLKKILIPLPNITEQKKIADILGSVDRAIEKTDEVIEKTEKLKKGLMQKLLTRGIGHDEFKEVRIGPRKYNIPKDWRIFSLNDVSNINGGGTPKRSIEKYWNGKIPWLTLSNISDRYINYLSKTNEYITENGLNNSSAKILPKGTIMISSRATIGEGVINRVPMTTNQGFVNIICDKSKFYNLYGLYLLRYFKNYLISLAGGSTFLEISKKSFRNIDVFIPKIKEQKLIANILLNIDNKINKEKKYKEKLERLKKGLMQKLLTGKIRVKTANSE